MIPEIPSHSVRTSGCQKRFRQKLGYARCSLLQLSADPLMTGLYLRYRIRLITARGGHGSRACGSGRGRRWRGMSRFDVFGRFSGRSGIEQLTQAQVHRTGR